VQEEKQHIRYKYKLTTSNGFNKLTHYILNILYD